MTAHLVIADGVMVMTRMSQRYSMRDIRRRADARAGIDIPGPDFNLKRV